MEPRLLLATIDTNSATVGSVTTVSLNANNQANSVTVSQSPSGSGIYRIHDSGAALSLGSNANATGAFSVINANTIDVDSNVLSSSFQFQFVYGTGTTATSTQLDYMAHSIQIFGSAGVDTVKLNTSISVNSVLQLSDGNDVVQLLQGTFVGTILLQAGDDTVEWHGTATTTGDVDWGVDTVQGADTIDITNRTTATNVALVGSDADGYRATASGLATGILFGVDRLVGTSATGHTLTGVNAVGTFTIDGVNSGSYSDTTTNKTLNFSGIANLTGNNNVDTFVIESGGSVSGTLSGSAGNDTLRIDNPANNILSLTSVTFVGGGQSGDKIEILTGSADSGTVTPTSATAGSIQHVKGASSQTINYSGVARIDDLTTDSLFTVNGTSVADTLTFGTGPTVNATATKQVSGSTISTVNYANKTTTTVNGLDGADVFNIDASTLTGTTNVNGGNAADSFSVTNSLSGGVTLNLDGGSPASPTSPADQLTVAAGSRVMPTSSTAGSITNRVSSYSTMEKILGAATHFTVSAASSANAGASVTVTVTAVDDDGTTDTGFTGTVHFTSSDGGASLPSDTTFIVGNSGVRTFNVTLATSGSQSVTVSDTVSSITGTTNIQVNSAPAISIPGSTISYTEGSTVPAIAPAGTISDSEQNWNTGTLAVQITANSTSTDRLRLVTDATVTLVGTTVSVSGTAIATTTAGASVNGGTALVFTFNANATNAAVQAVLRALAFDNTSDDPATTIRTITVSLTDGGGLSASSATVTASVVPTNDAPVLANTATVSATGGGAAVIIDPNLTVTDLDNTTLATATVTITNFVLSEDSLSFVNDGSTMGDISVSANASGVLTLSSSGATATVTEWQAALRAVTYANSKTTPTLTARTVEFSISDGSNSSSACPARSISWMEWLRTS